jgi:DNA-binding beta-propeller fold protein YncE
MRWAAGAVAVLILGAPASAAAHAPTQVSSRPVEVCRITDPAVTEVSGLAVTPTGYLVENDSNPDPAKTRVFTLDKACKVTGSVQYPRAARDPEDLAVDRKGTVWIADIGDNGPMTGGSGARRSTIALWTMAAGSKNLKIHRLVYPDGVPRDAEALLIDGQGRPVIVTKDPNGEVFRLDTPLPTDNTDGAKLTKVGAFEPHRTGTSNPFSFFGIAWVTGAAVSADGTRAVVRTYADAYEFEVTGGDVAKAITSGKPTVTPLPDEPQGEAIAYTADATGLLTVSDQAGPVVVLRYPSGLKAAAPSSAAPSAPRPAATQAAAAPPKTPVRSSARAPLLLAAFTVVALMLVAAVARRARRR